MSKNLFNFSIKDNEGKVAFELSSDKNIIKLFNKKIKKKLALREAETSSYEILRNLTFIPPKPPKTLGFIQKMGMFVFNFNLRFIEIDAIGGSLKRYKNYKDYPNTPQ